MESRGMRGVAFVFLVSLLCSGSSAGIIGVYWGQHDNESSLEDTCVSGKYGIVILASLIQVGNGQTPVPEFGGHCNPSLGECKELSREIDICHSSGIKVFLSIGLGGVNIVSENDAAEVASYLWNHYLGGQSEDRPLGDAVLDGIDFDIENAGDHLDDLARELNKFGVSLSAAPECPDISNLNASLGPALMTGLFDYVWIKFYNNPPCDYENGNAINLLNSWNEWTTSVTTAQTPGFFLGLPASPSPELASSGYIPPEALISDVLPQIKDSPYYGGVMLWTRFWDEQTNYSSYIKDYVITRPSVVKVPTLVSVLEKHVVTFE